MKSKFLSPGFAMAVLNIFAPAGGHAQDYIVNGHKASEAEAQFPVSHDVQPGTSQTVDEHPTKPVPQNNGRKCWYVLDALLCD